MDKRIKYQQIGQRIKEAREAKGLTQAQLGEKLNVKVTATAISLYEKGDRDVPVDVLTEIANLTGVALEYLASGVLNSNPSISIALRADKDLGKNEKARKQVLDFIEFMKNKVDNEKNE